MAEQHLAAKIKEIDNTGKPLVLLLKGPGKDSSMMEMILRTSGLATLQDRATLFVLSAVEQATSMPPIVQALSKASLPGLQTTDLPVVLVLNGDGKALSVTRGLVTATELQQSLTHAVTSFHSQESSLPPQPVQSPSHATLSSNATPHSTDKKAVSDNIPPTLAPTQPSPPLSTEASVSTAAPSASAVTSAAPASPSTPAAPMPAAGKSPQQQQASTTPIESSNLAPAQPLADVSRSIQLQIYLPDGQAVRGSFKGATALKEVCSYIDQQVASVSGQDYRLVSLHPAKEFSDSDMTKSLAELGLQSQTSLRIRHKQVSTGSRSTLMAQLMQLLVTLNPVNLVNWILTQFRNPSQDAHRDAEASQQQQQHTQQPASGHATGRQTGTSQARRRRSAVPGKVHTVHDDDGAESGSDEPDSNQYWNGNSTQFDADDQ